MEMGKKETGDYGIPRAGKQDHKNRQNDLPVGTKPLLVLEGPIRSDGAKLQRYNPSTHFHKFYRTHPKVSKV